MSNGSHTDNTTNRHYHVGANETGLVMSPDFSHFAKERLLSTLQNQRLSSEATTDATRVLQYPSPLSQTRGDDRPHHTYTTTTSSRVTEEEETAMAKRLREYRGMFLDLVNTGELCAPPPADATTTITQIDDQDTQLSPPTISSPTQRSMSSSSSSFPSQFSSSGSTSSIESASAIIGNSTTTRTLNIQHYGSTEEDDKWRAIRDKYIGTGDDDHEYNISYPPHHTTTHTTPPSTSTASLFVGGTYHENNDDDAHRGDSSTTTAGGGVVYLRLVQEDGTIHHVRMRANTPFSWLVLSGYEGFHMYFRHRRLKWSHTPKSQGFDTLQTSPDFPVSLFLVSAKPRNLCPTTGHRIGGLGTSIINVLLVPTWQLQPMPSPRHDVDGRANADDDGDISIEKVDEPPGRKVTLRCVLPCAINTLIDTLCAEGVITYEAALDLQITEEGALSPSSGGMVACKRTRRGIYEMMTSQSILKEGDELYLGGV